MNEYFCLAPGCMEIIGEDLPICPKHWRLVPWRERHDVLSTRPQRRGDESPAYFDALWAAMVAITPKLPTES